MILLITIFLILYLLLTLRRLNWAVMFLIAALPSYHIRFNVFGIPSTLLEAMILIVSGVWIFQNYKNIFKSIKNKFENRNSVSEISHRYPFDIEIILLLAISLVAVGVGGLTNQAFGIWKAYFFEPILLYIIIFNVIINKEAQEGVKERISKIILWPLLVSALAVSLLAVYQKITGQLIGNPLWAAESTRRVVSFFGYPNAVGLYLAPLILVFIGWVKGMDGGKMKKSVILLAIFVSFLSIIFAKSVGATLGVVSGLIIFGLFANKKARIATIAIIIIAGAGILSFQNTRQTAYKYLTLNDFSGQVRKSQWDETWKMLKDGRIIFGAGLANYQKSVAPYHHEGIWIKDIFDPEWLYKQRTDAAFRQKAWQPLEIFLYPHDIFLNFWTELGLAGMLLFVWLIGKFFYMAIRIFKKNNFIILGLMGAMVAIVVQGLVDVPYFKNDLSAMFWVMMAVMGVLSLENKKAVQ